MLDPRAHLLAGPTLIWILLIVGCISHLQQLLTHVLDVLRCLGLSLLADEQARAHLVHLKRILLNFCSSCNSSLTALLCVLLEAQIRQIQLRDAAMCLADLPPKHVPLRRLRDLTHRACEEQREKQAVNDEQGSIDSHLLLCLLKLLHHEMNARLVRVLGLHALQQLAQIHPLRGVHRRRHVRARPQQLMLTSNRTQINSIHALQPTTNDQQKPASKRLTFMASSTPPN